MKKKIIIALSIIGFSTICVLYFLYASFNGSIIQKCITTSKVKDYVKEHYDINEYDVEFATYDFKMVGYYCNVQSKTSEDTRFEVYKSGDEYTDDYEFRVSKKENTIGRLSRNLDDYIEDFLEKNYPHRTVLSLLDIDGEITDEMRDKLKLDMEFDMDTFPLPLSLTVWTETCNEYPSYDEVEKDLYELYDLTSSKGLNIKTYSLAIYEKFEEDENGNIEYAYTDKQCYVYDVPVSVIKEHKVKEFIEKQQAEEKEGK